MKLSNRFVLVGILLALVLAAGATWVFAQSAEIQTCVNKGGLPRIVASNELCSKLPKSGRTGNQHHSHS